MSIKLYKSKQPGKVCGEEAFNEMYLFWNVLQFNKNTLKGFFQFELHYPITLMQWDSLANALW